MTEATMIQEQPLTMTQRAVNELTEFNDLIQKVIPYGMLTVAEDGIGKVEEAHKAVKKLHASIEGKREELKRGALNYGKTVDSIATQLKSKVKEVESKLKAERDAFDAIKENERMEKERQKQAAKQARLDAMVANGIPVDLVAADLPDDEWMWWLSKAVKEAEARRAAEAEQARLREEESARQAEELRVRAEEIERQRIADEQRLQSERRQLQQEREEIEAHRAEERRKLAAEQEFVRQQQEELRKADAEKLEEQRAEERKRREDAARPELERLAATLASMRMTAEKSFNPMPWWAPEFAVRFEQYASMMRDFVREGEA